MDYVSQKNYATKKKLKKKLKFKINSPLVLFTQHPVPLENKNQNHNF